jgi:Calx-beta domain-containing protein
MRDCTIGYLLLALGLLGLPVPAAMAQQCPATLPVQGAPPPAPLPVFPVDNWWNTDIRTAPVDPASAGFIAFIGATRKLHPDFGGEESPGSTAIYGFPYAIIGGTQAKKVVGFDYDDESDGNGVAFYPIPSQAITQAHWVEGGAPGNIDQRDDSDRHLLLIDCTHNTLYELYNVFYDTSLQKWHAGSGAFFDMNTNNRRPEGWTSADAAGLAIFPGLVRYDEAANAAVPDINHAFRVTVRSSNGHVFPASHDAGSVAGALPMGARLRLKTSVGGVDPATRTGDPVARKIFRAMQKYGLIVADNGSDMYISGTFDLRWNNDALNPAFSTLSASDFEVVQLGWKPATTTTSLNAVSATPNPVTGGQSSTGKVSLTAAAPVGGAKVNLASASNAFTVPASVTVPQGAANATFTIATVASATTASGTLSATYAGLTRTKVVTVNATPLTLSLADASIVEGDSGTSSLVFNIKLSRASTTAVTYNVATTNGTATAGSDYVARSLAGQAIASGQTGKTFAVTVNGDIAREANETFKVTLSVPNGATILDGQAIGTILTDEVPRMSGPLPPILQRPTAKQAAARVVAGPLMLQGSDGCAWHLRPWRLPGVNPCPASIPSSWWRAYLGPGR